MSAAVKMKNNQAPSAITTSTTPKKKRISSMTSDELRSEVRDFRENEQLRKKDMDDLRALVTSLTERLITLEGQTKVYNPEIGLEERILQIERRCNKQEQYSRRETIELVGLPENVNGFALDELVVDTFQAAGVNVGYGDFHAIHRMKKKSVVIAKLVNRRDAISVLKNKKKLREGLSPADKEKLKSGKIYVNESLCDAYRRLNGQCNRLFRKKKIKNFYVMNGKVIIKMDIEGVEETKLIEHEVDLIEIFGKTLISKLFDNSSN